MHIPKLIVMLTYNDRTVKNAYKVFDEAKNSKAEIWGMKEDGLDFSEMKKLFAYMKQCGKNTALEAVVYTETEALAAAKCALDCKCDILMGTLFFDSVNELCIANGIKYMPFVGKVLGRPSVLDGTCEQMINQANSYIEKGVFGVDLLGYRFIGDKESLVNEFSHSVQLNTCVAGSIDSFRKLDVIKKALPWGFTVGSAFFDNCFGNGFEQQINTVCDYMEK